MEKNPRKVFPFIDFPSAHISPPQRTKAPLQHTLPETIIVPSAARRRRKVKKGKENTFELFIFIAP